MIYFIVGCEEDPVIYTENDYLPIIYCVFCPEDSIIKVRVGRSYQGNKSAYQTAKEPDTAFIFSLNVSLELISKDNKLLLTRQEIPLKLIQDRQNGIFYRNPNYCFISKTYIPLSDEFSGVVGTLRLQLFDPGLNRYSIGESFLLPKPEITGPRNELGKFQASFYSRDPFEVHYKNIGYPFELKVVFYYKEIVVGQSAKIDTISWNILIPFTINEDLTHWNPRIDGLPIWGDDFFLEISRRIQVESMVSRQFVGFDIELYMIDPILRKYEELFESISDIDPGLISNIANGLGIFACIRKDKVEGLKLDPRSLDSLCGGRFTKNLSFKKW